MAALPQSNTPRAFITYTVHGQTHTMMVRVSADASDGVISEDVGAFLDAMSGIVSASTFVKFERSVEGSNVRVPAVWSGPTTWGTGAGDTDDAPFFYSFTGKDVLGHKARVDLYGRPRGDSDPWRFDSTVEAVGLALDALRTSDPVFNTINHGGALWNDYANASVSQHWVKQARK